MLVKAVRAAVDISVGIEKLLEFTVDIDAERIILLACGEIENAVYKVSLQVIPLESKDIASAVVCIYPAERCGIVIEFIQRRLGQVKLIEPFYILVQRVVRRILSFLPGCVICHI